MEWINEGLTLIFLGTTIIVATFTESAELKVKRAVYVVSLLMFVAMATLSLFTGFRIDSVVFRLCPPIFCLSAALLLAGILKTRSAPQA
jgi:predicted membrane channel-forming protein YqfA (hemolysin III family)